MPEPVHYWPFINDYDDAVGSATSTLNGDPITRQDQNNWRELLFDGSAASSHVKITDGTTYAGDWTLVAFVRMEVVNGGDYPPLFQFMNSAYDDGIAAYFYSVGAARYLSLDFYYNGNYIYQIQPQVELGKNNLLCIRHDASEERLYFRLYREDGILYDDSGGLGAHAAPLRVGTLDDCRIGYGSGDYGSALGELAVLDVMVPNEFLDDLWNSGSGNTVQTVFLNRNAVMEAVESGTDVYLQYINGELAVEETGQDIYREGRVASLLGQEHGTDSFSGEMQAPFIEGYLATEEQDADILSGTIVEPTPAPVDLILSGITPSGFTLCWTRGS